MYTLLKSSTVKKTLISEMPSFAISLIIGEAFYEFGSFILECSAFVCTWYCISYLLNKFIFKARKAKFQTANEAGAETEHIHSAY
jgi:hypothetical protein